MKNSQSNVQCRYREKINYRLFDYLINDDLKIPYRFLLELTRFALEIFYVMCAARVNQIEFGICARGTRVFIDRRRSSLNYFSQCSNIETLANCLYNAISVFKYRRSILHEFLNFYHFSKFNYNVMKKN